ncbi:unnamed protein product [Ectocarpus sp. CCAP 1310/34]|nr:unnamed protein product [Ectocarpus sp. CCAP 1310/34]
MLIQQWRQPGAVKQSRFSLYWSVHLDAVWQRGGCPRLQGGAVQPFLRLF